MFDRTRSHANVGFSSVEWQVVIRGNPSLVALRKPPRRGNDWKDGSGTIPGWGYCIDPRQAGPRASAIGGPRRLVDAGRVPRRRRLSVADQGDERAVAADAGAAPTEEYAEGIPDPRAHLQGRVGARSLEAGHDRPLPAAQSVSDLPVGPAIWGRRFMRGTARLPRASIRSRPT